MSTVDERPPANDGTRTPASGNAPDHPPRPAGPAGPPPSTALAMASIHISRGNPTPEETAAVAALLMARLCRLHETGPSAGPRSGRLPHRPGPAYRAPGTWAS
ncbi:acyl-CoA carboxylase epsilon subunit [Streptomyces sp. NPDC001744]|uniref:acyl-CoA carboxylase epsilon subunit n=1 Tax=Streptomyces sp. NPDC001744 TaxID=3364606 RepID=UPI0036744DE8